MNASLAHARQNKVCFAVDLSETSYDHIEAGESFDERLKNDNAKHYTRTVEQRLNDQYREAQIMTAALRMEAEKVRETDPAKAQKLDAMASEIEGHWNTIIERPPGVGRNHQDFKNRWDARMDEADQLNLEAYNMLEGEPTATAATLGNTAGPVETDFHNPTYPDGTTTSETSASDSASGTAGTSETEEPGPTFTNEEIDQMMNDLIHDPASVLETLSGLSAEERGDVMALLQQRLNHFNQMQSMMTNLQKAMHDTFKATISNMRV